MSEDKDWRPASEHSGCLLRLQKLLERAQGFRLLILSHNRPKYRDNLIARLRQAEPDSVVLDLKRLGSLAAFESELARQQMRQVHLLNLESLRKEQRQDFFKGINYHREHIARTCAGFLLFWLPEHLIARLAVEAADFWAWREQVFDFSLPKEPVERAYSNIVKIVNTDASAKEQRIQEIKDFLSTKSEKHGLISADLKRELGGLYWSVGKYSEARKITEAAIAEYGELDDAQTRTKAQLGLIDILEDQGEYQQVLIMLRKQVMPIVQQLNSELGQAVVLGRIARTLQSLGQVDEALRTLKEEVLPMFERLADLYGKTTALDQIANILYKRGNLDEALKIWKYEVLPMFERFDDLRSKALTIGRIADIIEQRGELNEALRIREQDELPVYELFGDISSKAVTLGKIAGILYKRGELDESLRILEHKVLPVLEQIGDVRELLNCRVNFAIILYEIDAKAHKDRIDELLRLALADANRLKLPKEIEWIEGVIKKMIARIK